MWSETFVVKWLFRVDMLMWIMGVLDEEFVPLIDEISRPIMLFTLTETNDVNNIVSRSVFSTLYEGLLILWFVLRIRPYNYLICHLPLTSDL